MKDSIEKVITLSAPVSRVWRALTDYREFGQWFRVDLEGPFEVGKVTVGKITYPGYEHMVWEALVEHMEPEHRFEFIWPDRGENDDRDFEEIPKTRVSFRLEPSGAGTRLTLTESGFGALPDGSGLEALRRNTEGWNIQAEHIAAHVDG